MSEKKTLAVTDQRCRFYEKEFPEKDELCIARFDSIDQTNCYCSLLEYNNARAMILLREISRRRVRSVSKIARVGQVHVAAVLRVDAERGYVDLSKQNMDEDAVKEAENRYNHAKVVHIIMAQLAAASGRTLLELNEKITWPLYAEFDHAYEAFEHILECGRTVLDAEGPNSWRAREDLAASLDFTLLDELFDTLAESIRRRLAPCPKKVKTVFQLTCFNPAGVDIIRDALLAAERLSTANLPLIVRLDVAPEYVIETTTPHVNSAKTVMNEALKVVKEAMESNSGQFTLLQAPFIQEEAAGEEK